MKEKLEGMSNSEIAARVRGLQFMPHIDSKSDLRDAVRAVELIRELTGRDPNFPTSQLTPVSDAKSKLN